jgi:alginate O-acetyltransferase complex protein AlgJ
MSRIGGLSPKRDQAPADPLGADDRPLAALGPARSGARFAFTALAVVFFLGPALLYLAGQQGKALSGERAVKAPSLSQGWAFFDDATQYFTQRLPLRNSAVTANNWISRNVFGTAPRYGGGLAASDQALPFGGVNGGNANGGYAQTGGAKGGHPIVAIGRDGWYFLQGELDIACSPPVDFDKAVQRWDSFVHTVRASGRNVVLLVAPEKSTIYPEYVAPGTVSWSCAWPQKTRLWSKIEAMRNPDVLPLRQSLLAMKRRDPGRLLYLPLDSHWNDIAALLLTEDALKHVGGPVQVMPADVRAGIARYTGDMTRFTGSPKTGLAPTETIQRSGDDRISTIVKTVGRTVTVHPGGARAAIPGTTLFLHDSYGDAAVPMLDHYAAQFIDLPWLFTNQQQIIQLIRQSKTVVIETVERDFLNRAALGIPQTILTPRFLAALPAQLGPAAPGR